MDNNYPIEDSGVREYDSQIFISIEHHQVILTCLFFGQNRLLLPFKKWFDKVFEHLWR